MRHFITIQANLHVADSMGPEKLVRYVQSLLYTYDTYLICMGLGPSISSVIAKSPAYSGLPYASSLVLQISASQVMTAMVRLCLVFKSAVLPGFELVLNLKTQTSRGILCNLLNFTESMMIVNPIVWFCLLLNLCMYDGTSFYPDFFYVLYPRQRKVSSCIYCSINFL